jgi:hypothetical protein
MADLPLSAPTADLFDRFARILVALDERGLPWRSALSLRFAAIGALARGGDPGRAASVHLAAAQSLVEQVPWYATVDPGVASVVASLLPDVALTPRALAAEVDEAHRLLRQEGFPYGGENEVLAVMLYRLIARQPLAEVAASRIARLFARLKKFHWWLTGAADLPVCAVLANIPAAPEEIVAAAEDLYQRLRGHRLHAGHSLQTASRLLLISPQSIPILAERFYLLDQAFADQNLVLAGEDFESLSLLTLLPHDPTLTVACVLGYRERVAELHPVIHGAARFALAADLAYLELAPWNAFDRASWLRRGDGDRAPPEDLRRALSIHRAVSSITAADACRAAIHANFPTPPAAWP